MHVIVMVRMGRVSGGTSSRIGQANLPVEGHMGVGQGQGVVGVGTRAVRGAGRLARTMAVLHDEGRRKNRRASHHQIGVVTDTIAVRTVDHAHLLGGTDKVLHGRAGTATVGLLEIGKLLLELLRDVTASLEVVELHVDHGTVDALEARGKADGTLDTVTGVGGGAAMDAAQADLSDGDRPLPTRGGGLDIFLGGAEHFDVLTDDAQGLGQRDTIIGHGKEQDTVGSTKLPGVRVHCGPEIATEIVMMLMRGAHHVGSRRIPHGVIHATGNSVHGRVRRPMGAVMRVSIRSSARRSVVLSPATAGGRKVAHLITTFHVVPMRRREAGRRHRNTRVGLLLGSDLAVLSSRRMEVTAHTHATVKALAEWRRERTEGTMVLERLVLGVVVVIATTATCSSVCLVELHHGGRSEGDGLLPRTTAHAGRIEANLNVAGRVGTAGEGTCRPGLQDLRVLSRHAEGHAGGEAEAVTGDGTTEGVAPRRESERWGQSRGAGVGGSQGALLLGIGTAWSSDGVAPLGGSSIIALPLLVTVSSSGGASITAGWLKVSKGRGMRRSVDLSSIATF